MIPYYRFRNKHKEITGRDDPVSIYGLLYFVEGPQEITGVDIWKYVQYIPIEELPLCYKKGDKYTSYQISRQDATIYPYRELIMRLFLGDVSSPLMFEALPEDNGHLRCFEGRHRLRAMILLHILLGKFDKIPAVVFDLIERKPEKIYPEKWEEYARWAEEHNLYYDTETLRRIDAKLIHEE